MNTRLLGSWILAGASLVACTPASEPARPEPAQQVHSERTVTLALSGMT